MWRLSIAQRSSHYKPKPQQQPPIKLHLHHTPHASRAESLTTNTSDCLSRRRTGARCAGWGPGNNVRTRRPLQRTDGIDAREMAHVRGGGYATPSATYAGMRETAAAILQVGNADVVSPHAPCCKLAELPNAPSNRNTDESRPPRDSRPAAPAL